MEGSFLEKAFAVVGLTAISIILIPLTTIMCLMSWGMDE